MNQWLKTQLKIQKLPTVAKLTKKRVKTEQIQKLLLIQKHHLLGLPYAMR